MKEFFRRLFRTRYKIVKKGINYRIYYRDWCWLVWVFLGSSTDLESCHQVVTALKASDEKTEYKSEVVYKD